MIIPKLIGRLGNNAFQIACAVGYARKHGIEYCIPKVTAAPHVWPNYFEHLSNCPAMPEREWVLLKETTHSYQELPPPPEGKDILIEGYWQSEKYFEHCKDEIRDLFTPKWRLNKGVVSVHVRRGDYLELQDKHPVVTDEYLLQSIKFMIQKGYNYFLFFSDDIPWCKEFSEYFYSNYYYLDNVLFGYSEGKKPQEDLLSMAECEHNIIANSSFSWWGAWLNRNPKKIVIAPKIWFGEGNSHLDTKNLIPESWIRL